MECSSNVFFSMFLRLTRCGLLSGQEPIMLQIRCILTGNLYFNASLKTVLMRISDQQSLPVRHTLLPFESRTGSTRVPFHMAYNPLGYCRSSNCYRRIFHVVRVRTAKYDLRTPEKLFFPLLLKIRCFPLLHPILFSTAYK